MTDHRPIARQPACRGGALLCIVAVALAVCAPRPASADAALQREIEALIATASDRPEAALDTLRRLEPAARVGSVDDQRSLLSALGYVRAQAGDIAGAMAAADELAALARQARAPQAQLESRLVRAHAHLAAGRYAQALDLLTLPGGTGPALPPRLSFWAAQIEGHAATELGRHDQALAAFQRALRVAETLGDKRRTAVVLHSLSGLHALLRQPEAALKSVQRAYSLARAGNDLAAMATYRLSEASLLGRQGRVEAQRAALDESLALSRRIGAVGIEAAALINLSDHHLQRNALATAAEYARAALPLAGQIGDWDGEATARFNLGLTQMLSGHTEAGQASVSTALRAWHEREARHAEADALREYAAVQKQLGLHAAAVESLERERALRETLFESDRQRSVLELQARFDSDRQRQEIALLERSNALQAAELQNHVLQQRIWWLAALAAALFAGVVGLFSLRVREKNRVLEARNRELSFHNVRDPLTGLFNRRHFQERMATEPNTVVDTEGRRDALFLIDIDHFKRINDRLGHPAGDTVLIEVAQRLKSVLRQEDVVVRWGGEEFLVFTPRLHPERLEEVAGRIMDALSSTPIAHEGREIPVTASVGYAPMPLEPGTVVLPWSRWINLIDMALYLAKAHGRGRAYGVRALASLDAGSVARVEKDLEQAWAEGLVELTVTIGAAAQPVA